MSRSLGFQGFFLALAASVAAAAPPILEIEPERLVIDVVGDIDGVQRSKEFRTPAIAGDTTWIADWSFDTGGACTDAGWIRYDNRINDGSNNWLVSNAFADTFGINGNAAVLRNAATCETWVGYGNEWDYSIVLKYRRGTGSDPAPTLAFDYLSDSEWSDDFVSIEADSGGASEARVNYGANPAAGPAAYRTVLASWDGVQHASLSMPLPDFGIPGATHEVYIRFKSDLVASDEDGEHPSRWHAGLVVDDIQVTGALAYTENFQGALNPNVQLVNSKSAVPFGEWGRVFLHPTDNDKCNENVSCAWTWVDPSLPGMDPNLHGPYGAAVRNWLDNVIVSPWVELGTTPGQTLLSFRRFGGSPFSGTSMAQGWRVRARLRVDNTETPIPGDSFDCVTAWGHANAFNNLSSFTWATTVASIDGFFPSDAREIQVSFRTADWQLVRGSSPPATLVPSPGPYLDRIRIGQRSTPGPIFDDQVDYYRRAQDCFPTYRNTITPGEHFYPSTDRFGSAAFSRARDISSGTHPTSSNLVVGDSITVLFSSYLNTSVIASIGWYGAIVAGPHAGKVPAPYTVGSNGFFAVTPDTCRHFRTGEPLAGQFFVDLDDTYFRGGDVLYYFWTATNAAGGFTSHPLGLDALPASIDAAEAATDGLFEVSFLPTINWDPAYLARIAADPHGDLDPTPQEIAGSRQRNCILYTQQTNPVRRSGLAQRTAFMYTLDQLGYRGAYDIYDQHGIGYANSDLGGRATLEQARGYALIILDCGEYGWLPDGSDPGTAKIDQSGWYRSYLQAGGGSQFGSRSFWLLGPDITIYDLSFLADLGLTFPSNQGMGSNPAVTGFNTVTWANGEVTDFAADGFYLLGSCPELRTYKGASATGTAVVTHRYAAGTVTGPGAVIANPNAVQGSNTVWSGFMWQDIRDGGDGPAGTPAATLLAKVLAGVVPRACAPDPSPTGAPPPEADVPHVTALHANVPNPFNPLTTIRFDLATAGRVRLRIYDVAGRHVRTLLDETRAPGWRMQVAWDGRDGAGKQLASGVYFSRLETPGFSATRKILMVQ